MISTQIIDGKIFAEKLRADIAKRVSALKAEKHITPGLAVIRVGEDPASEVYVRNKVKQTKEAGMNSWEYPLPERTSEGELLSRIDTLNHDPAVHGILVQLPLPAHISKDKVLNAVNPDKDVDGFHPDNVKKLEAGEEGFVPCTPLGCMMLLKEVMGTNLRGKKSVVVGRSPIVGKPMAELLRKAGAEVSVIHSKTTDDDRVRWLREADIVVVAVGKPHFIHGTSLKEGVVVIDVGINRTVQPDGKTKLVGDVDFASCQGIAAAITPVPGGVGPMTIACLLENTYRAATK
jgi:methylenetetrahydrofolate dehydrogenase (NADP+)/methenyltetrahydrofolate cyclohydrolase